MARKRYSPEQIIIKLREAEECSVKGKTLLKHVSRSYHQIIFFSEVMNFRVSLFKMSRCPKLIYVI